jgi:hypothetical protein
MPVVANQYNIVVEQGGTYRLEITYKDADGDAIDLTNHVARMEIRQTYTSESALVTITSAAGGSGDTSGIALGGAAGTIVVVIAAATTTGLTAPATNVYDLELVAQNGAVTRLLEGKATVSPGVTTSTYTG